MPECTHLARTSAYFDGALPNAEEAEALAHLEGCAECQALLRDAVTFDAVISQAPARSRAQSRRRWPFALAAIGGAAAAAAALWIALSPGPRPPEVAIALPHERAMEARFSGTRFDAYRPYAPLRGDRAHESIALGTLAELERRGDVPDLIAALVATGDLARAGELAAKLPDGAAAESDRAALALAGGASEEALAHAYHAIDRAPALAAGWWNLALAARAQGLLRVSRAAFAKVVERAEPGWADEARRQIAPLDREIAREDTDFPAYLQRGRAMIDGGELITVDDVRRFPTWARIHVLDALRVHGGWTAVPLQSLTEELDRQSGTQAMAAARERAQAGDPGVRARFVAGYRAVVAHTATPAEISDLLAKLRAAGHGVDDIRAGAILLSGRVPALLDELRAIVAPWHDPWFDLAVEREQIRATWPRDDVHAEPALIAVLGQCTGDAWALRCGQLAYDLADRLGAWGRPQEAERWARTALERYRAAGSPPELRAARTLLAELHKKLAHAELARAELDEVARSAAAGQLSAP
jgi:cellulose synthase operon protein C